MTTSNAVNRSNSTRTRYAKWIPWQRRVKSLLFRSSADQSPLVRYHQQSSSRSVIGGRQQNEDRVYHNDREGLYLVADGMGGYHGGALASQIVVETVPVVLTAAIERRIRVNVSAAFDRSIQFACDEMARVAAEHPNYQKMGCTLAAALVRDDTLYCLSIGDCRAYLYRQGRIIQLTRDQTMVQELVDRQVISALQARTNRLRHIVTNSVSANGLQLTPELKQVKLKDGDAIVLTSDGLTNELTASDFESVMHSSESVKTHADQLVDLAIDRGAHDNVSAVVVQHRASL